MIRTTDVSSKIKGGVARSLCLVLSLAVLFFSPYVRAQTADRNDWLDRQIVIDIPNRTPLENALIEWGIKTGVTVMVSTPNVEYRFTDAIRGTLSARAALAALLKNSGLTYTVTGERIRIIPLSQTNVSLNDRSDDAEVALTNAEGASVYPSRLASISDEIQGGGEHSDSTDNVNNSSGLAEVLVTAQKREERAIDVPISIVAVSADELAKQQAVNLDDLSNVVPGLAIQSTGGQRRIMLRGISNVFGNSSQIGLYLDEATATSGSSNQLDLNVYDLQRVEVLRGPQGTLYGEGSIGGTVRLITNDPQLQTFSMKSDIATLFTQEGAPSQRIQEAVNVPLVQDVFGIRVAGTFDHEGGWVDQPSVNQKNINDENMADVRLKTLWVPDSKFFVSTMVDIHRNNEVPGTGEDANGNFTQVFNLGTVPHVEDDYNLYNTTITYNFDVAKVLSTTTYFTQKNTLYNQGVAFDFFGPGMPLYDLYTPVTDTTTSSLTEELRVSSTNTTAWQWTVGAYFRRFRYALDSSPGIQGLAIPPGTPSPAPSGGPFDENSVSKSESLFADTSYKLWDRLTLGAGVRGFKDDEDFDYLVLQEATFHSVDPRFYLDLKLTSDANIYASAAKGFRSGGFNYAATNPTFGPENVWTYELGTKFLTLERSLSADANVFYSKYNNYISVGINASDLRNYYQNAGNAVVKGVETEVNWRPADKWTVTAQGDYLDSYFTTITLAPSSSPYDVGDPLDLTPKYQGDLSLERDFQVQDRPLFARVDYSVQGRSTYRNRSTGPWYFSESDVIHLLNFNSGLQWSDDLSMNFFIQNLLNDRGYTTPIVIEGAADRARPRTYGVNFEFRLK